MDRPVYEEDSYVIPGFATTLVDEADRQRVEALVPVLGDRAPEFLCDYDSWFARALFFGRAGGQ